MSELLRELEEDIRRERMANLWNKFGKAMVAASIVVVVITIAVVVWQNHKQSVAMEQTSKFLAGIDRLNVEDYQGAMTTFDALSQDAHSPYYALAMFRKAQAQTARGDKDGALKTYEALAKEESASPEKALPGLARILAAEISGGKVEPVKSSPLYHTQSEWKAWQLLEEGKTDDAVDIFAALRSDDRAPGSMRARSAEILRHIAPQRIEKDDANQTRE